MTNPINLPRGEIATMSTVNFKEEEILWLEGVNNDMNGYSDEANLTVHMLDIGFLLIYPAWEESVHTANLEYLKNKGFDTLALVLSNIRNTATGYVHIDPDMPAVPGLPEYEW